MSLEKGFQGSKADYNPPPLAQRISSLIADLLILLLPVAAWIDFCVCQYGSNNKDVDITGGAGGSCDDDFDYLCEQTLYTYCTVDI